MPSSSSDVLFPLIAATAAAVVAGLVAAQSDTVSRQILDPAKLEAKRRAAYHYQWKTAVEKAHMQLDYYFAGGQKHLHDDPEIVFKRTEYLSSDHDLEALVHRILAKSEESIFYTLKIDKDPHDPTGEFYMFFLEDSPSKGTVPQLYQVPLMAFGLKLAEAFEDQLTNTTLCFVADASAGKASHLLEQLVKESKTGVAVLKEPLWMVNLARIVNAQLFPAAKIQKLLFALVRMDAWSLREEVKESRTVMITLPGQSTVATLLPLVQNAFPEDRHVFCYDGCVASVEHGIRLSQTAPRRDQMEQRLQGIIHSMCQNPILHTTPLPTKSPLTKPLPKLAAALKKLPVSQAQSVESWMSSVDAYFQMKMQEMNNGYLPYVFKLSFLTQPSDRDFTPKSDPYWSVSSLLQYITGTRSRPMAEGVMDAAIEFLKDYNAANNALAPVVNFTEIESKLMENCVFQHKLILIGNKTLQDTVMPTQHWTLKQASKKGGCACCGPDPFDEEEDEEQAKREAALLRNAMGNRFDVNEPGVSTTSNNNSSSTGVTKRPQTNYVDGKLGFAFDPTRFS